MIKDYTPTQSQIEGIEKFEQERQSLIKKVMGKIPDRKQLWNKAKEEYKAYLKSKKK